MTTMSQLTLARFLKLIDPRPHDPGRGSARVMRASDIILLMMVALLTGLVLFRFLHG
jgi:hypothetical protein